MAVQPYPFLRLTDGTTTVTFADGAGGATSYPLVRATWAPSVAPLRKTVMGGQWPHEDVVEELVINVRGATAAITLANLRNLATLLDQAERWNQDQNVAPVLLQYAPQGSTFSATATPLQAVVLGRAKGDETLLNLGERMNDAGMLFEIRNVKVRLWRRGVWLFTTPETATSAATAIAVRGTVTFPTSAPTVCPTTVTISNLLQAYDVNNAGALLMAQLTSFLVLIDATSLTGGGVAIVADAANLPRNGSVLRMTSGDKTAGGGAIAGLDGRLFDIYATMRANSGDDWMVQIEGVTTSTSFPHYYDQTAPCFFSPGSTEPQAVFLGTLSMRVPPTQLFIAATQLTGAASSLDVDVIAVLATDAPGSHAVMIDGGLPWFDTSPVQLQLQDRALTYPDPIVEQVSGAPNHGPASFRGDYALTTVGNTAAAVLLLPCGVRWRMPNTAGTVVLSPTFSLSRLLSALAPL